MVLVLGLGDRFSGGMQICHPKFVKRRKDEYPEVYVTEGSMFCGTGFAA